MELLEAASEGIVVRVEQLLSAGVSVDVTDNQGRTALSRAASGGHLDVVCVLMEHGADVDARDSDDGTPLMRAAENGHLNMARFLVEHGADVDARGSDGSTPLMRAAENGHLNMARFLVEHGAAVDASDSFGWTPLMQAASGGHLDMMRFLMEHGAAVDAADYYGQTLLTQSASDGQLDVVQFLVEQGAAIDASNFDGWTMLMQAASGGHFDMVRYLVDHGVVVDASDNYGQSPLMRAAENGHLSVVRFLVEHGAAVDSSDIYGCTPLICAASDGHMDVVRSLVEYGAALDAMNSDGSTPLLRAAIGGHLDVMQFLVEHGATVDASNNDETTPLMQAAENGRLDMMQLLVEHGAAVDAINRDGQTLLTQGASGGQLDVVRFLVGLGAAVDASDNYGWTPLMQAAGGGHLDVVRFLVEHGAAVDASDNYSWTPLIRAANDGHFDVARFLVEHGAVVDASNKYGQTPLMRAAENGHLSMVQLLVEYEASVDASDNYGQTLLSQSASGGHLDVMQFLIEHGTAVDASDNYGWTPLMQAASGGHFNLVQFLVEHGAAVDASDNDGGTPLLQAASGGHLDIVRYLVEHGSAVDAVNSVGRTPLICAANDGHFDVVRFLVEHGAVVDAINGDGGMLLIIAAIGDHLDMVRFLVEHGAVVDASDNDGQTPLIFAARCGHLDVVQFLVEHGAAVNASDINGETPLMLGASGGHLEVVQLLVEHGAVVDPFNCGGQMPLTQAAIGGHLDVARFLVEHGADVDATDNYSWTPLMRAASGGNLDIVRILVEHGAVVDAINSDGRTPLICAANDGHFDVVHFLVEHGAVVDASNTYGQTPLMRAAENGHLDVVRFLVKHGAAVNAINSDGWTSLMLAAENGHLDVVRFLVEHGANPNTMSMTGDTALSSATTFGRQEVVQFLLPLVRYQDQRTQTEQLDEHEGRPSSIPNSWLIPPFELEVEPFVNAGNIGGDFRGKWLDADVVVKLFVDGTTSATFVDELRLWYQLRHPNILKLYGVCNSFHHLFVCESASKGSLPEYLKSCDAEHQTPWKFLYEAALGLEYLHERKIIHGNLRGNNILIGNDGLAKLSGFRLNASTLEGRWYASGMLVRWAAPESLRGENVSFASDVYSLGMCIVEAVTGKVPYDMEKEWNVPFMKNSVANSNIMFRQVCSTFQQQNLLMAMCQIDPHERLQMPAVVNKLELFAEMEAGKRAQPTAQPKPEPLVSFDAFDDTIRGKTVSMWVEVKTLVAQSENDLYNQMWHELELIYNTLKTESHPWSTMQRFHDMLIECRITLDTLSQHNRICRLSSTRARDYSVQGLRRRMNHLHQLIRPQDQDAERREMEWKRLCREQVEVFVSEASEACVMLSSVDSEEDRSALVAVLRAELRNTEKKYTGKQLAVLQKTYDDIVSNSLEDVDRATTPEWFIPWFELEMNEMTMLGEGGFGSVIKAKWLDSEVVVKKLEIVDKNAESDDKKREMRQMFEREVDIWFGLSHPHVVRLFGACHVGRPFFVCELAPNGTLDEYLCKHPDELWSKLREAALGVQYLHSRGIVHGDLKGNNILIGSDGKARVTDFGLSGVFGDDSTEVIVSGAWHWVAPECLLGQKTTFASDIYSLGMCIIEALRVTNDDEDELPWGNMPNAAVKFHVTRRHRLPPRPQNCFDEAWTLIERMCKSDPADRMLIMTVVDELEKLASRRGDPISETDHIVSDNSEMQLSSSSVADDALTEMKNWIGTHVTNQDWEGGVLKNIYQLLWDRLEQVATQLLSDSDGPVIDKSAISDFSSLVGYSQIRARTALGNIGTIALIKFTELALGGYALHRRLDKFMAAHAVPKESNSLHDWISACSMFVGASNSPTPISSDVDCSANDEADDGTRIALTTEVAAAS